MLIMFCLLVTRTKPIIHKKQKKKPHTIDLFEIQKHKELVPIDQDIKELFQIENTEIMISDNTS